MMKKSSFSFKKVLALALPLLTTVFSLSIMRLDASPLKAYRDALKQANPKASYDELSSKRLEEIRSLLGHLAPKIEFKTKDGTPLNYPGIEVQPKRMYSSSFFRQKMGDVTENLRMQSLYDVEIKGDPSKSSSEIKNEMFQRDYNMFEKHLGDFNQLLSQIVQQQENEAQVKKVEVPADAKPYLASLTEQMKAYIKNTQPKEVQPGIEALLGELQTVEIHDGVIDRLLFKRDKEDATPISLSMLVSFRTHRDLSFVNALRLLEIKINWELENNFYERDKEGHFIKEANQNFKTRKLKDDEFIRYSKLDASLTYVREKWRGAVIVGTLLALLKPEQLHYMIDLFLQLRSSEIPSEDELADLAGLLIKKFPQVPDPIPQDFVDLALYTQFSNELNSLKDILQLESSMKAQKEMILNEIEQKAREVHF